MSEFFQGVVDAIAAAGIKVVWLVFGFFGAALGVRYSPPMTKADALTALVAGVVCAGFGPPLLTTWFSWHMPPIVDNAIAFVCGICGMFVVPGILNVGRAFVADPVGMIAKARSILAGKGEPK